MLSKASYIQNLKTDSGMFPSQAILNLVNL